MHILAFLNVSNKDNISTDSAYIFYSLLSNSFIQLGHSFSFASPSKLPNKAVNNIQFDFGNTKYEVRFHFDWEKTTDLIKKLKPDIIIVNQIELLANYKAVVTSLSLDIPIVGYAHYLPFFFDRKGIMPDPSQNNNGLNSSIRLNFLSGLLAADKVFVHSKTALGFIKRLFKCYQQSFPKDKFVINPPPSLSYSRQIYSIQRNNIIYNHRLYAHYGTQWLIDFVKMNPFKYQQQIQIFDILANRNHDRKKLDTSVEDYRKQLRNFSNVQIRTDGGHRSVYIDTLSKALCCLAPYRKFCPWSMSCVDAMAQGIPCVAPDFDWFSEYIPKQLLFKTSKQARTIIEKLSKDQAFWEKMSKQCHQRVRNLTPDLVAKKFLKCFELLIERKRHV